MTGIEEPNEKQALNSAYLPEYKIYKRRWYILILFSLLSLNQSNIWITYGAVLDTAKEMYRVSDNTVNLLAAMGPVGFIPLSFFSSWMIGEYGLRVATIFACILCSVGAILRCFATDTSFWLVIVAQIINAAAGPVVMNAPPALSAIWFGVNERTFATAVGSLSNYMGSATGFLLGLIVYNTLQLKYLLYAEALVTVVLMLIVFIYFPARPPRPPSATAAMTREKTSLYQSFRETMMESAAVFRSKDGIIVLMTSGIVSGINGGWAAMLVYILAPYYSQWDIQWLGFFNILAGVIGGLILGKVHDHFRHFKFLMILFFFLSSGLFVVMSLATQRIIVCTFAEIMVLNVAIGIAINALYPISFEALIEVTYPVKEEISANLVCLVNNFACLGILILGAYATGNYINWTMGAVCFVCFVLILFTKETYKRTKIDLVKNW